MKIDLDVGLDQVKVTLTLNLVMASSKTLAQVNVLRTRKNQHPSGRGGGHNENTTDPHGFVWEYLYE